MRYNNLIASLTIALVALASLAAMIWQVVQGHDTDAQLAGILGLSLGAFLRMPGQADPAPAKEGDDAGLTGIGILIALAAAFFILCCCVWLTGHVNVH